jgi:hypothetical protein
MFHARLVVLHFAKPGQDEIGPAKRALLLKTCDPNQEAHDKNLLECMLVWISLKKTRQMI